VKTILFWLFTEIQSKELGFVAIRCGAALENLINFSKLKFLIALLCLFCCLNISITNKFDYFVYSLAYLIIEISLQLFILYIFIDKNSILKDINTLKIDLTPHLMIILSGCFLIFIYIYAKEYFYIFLLITPILFFAFAIRSINFILFHIPICAKFFSDFIEMFVYRSFKFDLFIYPFLLILIIFLYDKANKKFNSKR
jgi:membrane protein